VPREVEAVEDDTADSLMTEHTDGHTWCVPVRLRQLDEDLNCNRTSIDPNKRSRLFD